MSCAASSSRPRTEVRAASSPAVGWLNTMLVAGAGPVAAASFEPRDADVIRYSLNVVAAIWHLVDATWREAKSDRSGGLHKLGTGITAT